MGSRCAVFRWTMCRGVPSEGIRRARMWRPMLGNWEGGGNKMADVDCVGEGEGEGEGEGSLEISLGVYLRVWCRARYSEVKSHCYS